MYILSRVWVTRTGFKSVIEFIEHLQIVTTSNYTAVANSHILLFTTARIKAFQSASFSPAVVW
jgi:hypothetical protein